MEIEVTGKSHRMLVLNTLAFTYCFAVWMFNGVMITFLVDKGVFDFTPIQIGWLIGIPVLTGSIFRIPLGILTDKYGGKKVFIILLIIVSIPMYLMSYANSYAAFVVLSFGIGLAGAAFAVGVAYTSVWYPKKYQGVALGTFGAGNAGAALTTLFAPSILEKLTNHSENLDNWRELPKFYAYGLLFFAVLFILFAIEKKTTTQRTLKQSLAPLKSVRVWRFGLYYFLVFGCFVAFAQWLMPYYLNVYGVSLITAGLLTSMFSLPSGVIRILGGWMSDKWGARGVMFKVFTLSILFGLLLLIPRMEVITPGKGIQALKNGKVEFVSNEKIVIGDITYDLKVKKNERSENKSENAIFPYRDTWQQPLVKLGDEIKKKQLIAGGTTQIKFDANIWIFTFFVIIIGIVWGVGKAGVYKFIPDYFPNEIGAVGGIIGAIGGVGGFLCPIIFGYLLEWTGLWTSCWMFILIISVVCYLWMKQTVRNIIRKHAPDIAHKMEYYADNNSSK